MIAIIKALQFVGLGEKLAKAGAWLLIFAAAAGLAWLAYSTIWQRGYDDREAEQREEIAALKAERDAAAARAATADAKLRAATATTITEQREELDDATADIPDQDTSARQRARACLELRRSGLGCPAPAGRAAD